jgi:hypothetical protein
VTVIFSIFALPFLSVVTAWVSATGLRGRKRTTTRIGLWIKLALRLCFWIFALVLCRDHFLRVAAANPAAMGGFELILGLGVAALHIKAMVSCERIRGRFLQFKKNARRDLLAGFGLGAVVAYAALSSGLIPVLSLFPRSLGLWVFLMVGAWAYGTELWLRALITPILQKFLPGSAVLLVTTALAGASWLGLALFGPFPALILLAPAAWLAVISALGYRYLGFAGAVGTHWCFLFLILMPL